MSFFEIFQPGLKHLREERDRQKTMVANPTHGGGAPLGIDLEAGTATITLPADLPPPDHEPADKRPAEREPGDKRPAEREPGDEPPAEQEPTPVQPVEHSTMPS